MASIQIELPTVMSLHIETYVGEKKLFDGTAFLGKAGDKIRLLTNRHLVTGLEQGSNLTLHPSGAVPDRIQIWFPGPELGNWKAQILRLIDGDQRSLWAQHPRLGALADFVALPAPPEEHISRFAYDLTDTSDEYRISPADTVSVVGFPFGMASGGKFAIWATGFIASEPQIDFGELPTFLIDCRTRQGQSWSAVIIHRGGTFNLADGRMNIHTGKLTKLLGIYSGRVNSESDLGKVWKREALLELVSAS